VFDNRTVGEASLSSIPVAKVRTLRHLFVLGVSVKIDTGSATPLVTVSVIARVFFCVCPFCALLV
jgi:hypothetical protein